MNLLQKTKQLIQAYLARLFGMPPATQPKPKQGENVARFLQKTGDTTRKLAASGDFPLRVMEGGRVWYAYSIEFDTPESRFRVVMYALSDYHAAIMVDDLRNSAFSGGRIIQRLSA